MNSNSSKSRCWPATVQGQKDTYRYFLDCPMPGESLQPVYPAVNSKQEPKIIKFGGEEHSYAATECHIRERRCLEKLTHPGIVRLEDWSLGYNHDEKKADHLPAIVLDFIEGPTLIDRIEGQEYLDADFAQYLCRSLAETLGYVHARGIIHRDVKPENIILRQGVRPVLLDFGLAYSSELAVLEENGVVYGTPMFMPPEQLAGERPTISNDVYALGVSLYQALTSTWPHYGARMADLERNKRQLRPEWISSYRDDLPSSLDSFFLTALEPDPKDRYQSADEFQEEFCAAFKKDQYRRERTA